MKTILCTIFLTVFSCAMTLLLHAQSGSATLVGLVTDPTGAAVVGASVSMLNADTKLYRDTSSSDVGEYAITLLPPGRYTLTVQKVGFKKFTQEGIILTVDQSATANVKLELGAVSQEVLVTAQAEQVNTTTAELGQVVAERAITELPLNGRNPGSLVFLLPGATNILSTSAGIPEYKLSYQTVSGAAVNGGRQGSTLYLLDGAVNMDTYQDLGGPFPNADATAEFRVTTNNYSAEYGFSPGAVVSIITKSGTNQIHGGVYEFLRNSDLNASNFFTHNIDTLKRNQFGGSLGGPIKKDKLFFFANYQHTVERTAALSSSAFLPTAAMRGGDFSSLLSAGIQIHDPQGNPYPNNQIPTSQLSKPALTLDASVPLGQGPTGLVYYGLPGTGDAYNQGTMRVDFNMSERQRLSARSYVDNFLYPGSAAGGNILGATGGISQRWQTHGLNYVWTINPSIVNNLVFDYTRNNAVFTPVMTDKDGNPICLSKLINVNEPTNYPCSIELFYLAGAAIGGLDYDFLNRHYYSFRDSLTINKGKHLFVAGVDVLRQDWNLGSNWLSEPLVEFDGSVTGDVLSDFLIGKPFYYEQGGGEFQHIKAWQMGFFAQDQYRVKPNLTATLGLRWEPNFPPTPLNGRTVAFRPGQQSTRYPNAPIGLVFPGDSGVGAGGMPTTLGYLDVRTGIAWQPSFLPRTSVRAAFGIFTAPLLLSNYNWSADTTPFNPDFAFTRSEVGDIDFSNPWANYAPTGGKSPFPPFSSAGYVPPANATIIRPVYIKSNFIPDFRLGQVQTWNFSIEHAFLHDYLARVAYVGSESYHLLMPMDLNPGIFANGGLRTTYPNFTEILTSADWATANYQSLQIGLEKRLSRNLQFQSNFTYSKSLDPVSTPSTPFHGTGINPFDWRNDRGLSDYNLPRVWMNNFVYRTPSLSGSNGFVHQVLGGWEISGIVGLQDGFPFSIVGGYGNDSSMTHEYDDRADFTGQPIDVHQGSKQQWLLHYVNAGAFAPNAPGTFGNTPRNFLRGPASFNADLGFMKNWAFRERYRLQFRWEMFNATNHPDFGLPNADPTSGAIGQITSTANVPRVMQGALKLYW